MANPTSSDPDNDQISDKKRERDRYDEEEPAKAPAVAQFRKVASSSKRPKMDGDDSSSHLIRTEKEVGIEEYVSAKLAPIEGIIKQRFSDFQVFEIAPDGTVCRLKDLGPPPASFPLTSPDELDLRKQLQREIAERNDASGELKRQRQEAQKSEREAAKAKKEHEIAKAREHVFAWSEEDVDLSREDELVQLVGQRVRDEIKALWEQGPSAFERTIESAETPTGRGSSSSDRGGRGGRGARGGRGGRGGGGRGQDIRGPRENGDPRRVVTEALADKERRGKVHQIIREVFKGRLLTETAEEKPSDKTKETNDEEDAMMNGEDVGSSAPPTNPPATNSIAIRWNPNPAGKDARTMGPGNHSRKTDEAALPPYIHFLLHKTNRDAQDAISIIARALNLGGASSGLASLNKIASRELSVAGTKDKRGITIQRVSFRRGRRTNEDLWKALNGVGKELENGRGGRGGRGGYGGRGGGRGGFDARGGPRKTLLDAVTTRGERGVRVAQLEYHDQPLFLGNLKGNRFSIVLRNVKSDCDDTIYEAVEVLKTKGFINYYGMQRFGTSSVSSHTIGLAVIKNDFAGAISLFMDPKPDDGEEMLVAKAFYAKGQVREALNACPRWATAERAILGKMVEEEKRQGSGKCSFNDSVGYFGSIPKTLRTMYVHSYQSYVWNKTASERARRFGLDAPVEGDIVFCEDFKGTAEESIAEDGPENGIEDGDEIAVAEDGASADAAPSATEVPKVKYLSAEEAASNKYTIHDILIPSCGSLVSCQPGSWMETFYDSVLAEDGLDMDTLSQSKGRSYELMLRGTYRRLLGRLEDVQAQYVKYSDPDQDLNQSDEDALLGIQAVPPTHSTIIEAAKAFEGQHKSKLDAGSCEGETHATATTTSVPESFLAMKVSFNLSTASYATMALRELTKQDTSSANQKLLTEQSEDQRHNRKQHINYLGVSLRKGEKTNEVAAVKGRQRIWGKPGTSTAVASEEVPSAPVNTSGDPPPVDYA